METKPASGATNAACQDSACVCPLTQPSKLTVCPGAPRAIPSNGFQNASHSGTPITALGWSNFHQHGGKVDRIRATHTIPSVSKED